MSAISPFLRVHVWEHPSYATENGNRRIQKYSPGHAALEIYEEDVDKGSLCSTTYISFFPPTHQCCRETESHFHAHYSVDEKYEGKASEQVDLYLGAENISKIKEAFEKFKAQPYEWSLKGSSILRRYYESNCSGLSLYLLEQAEIKRGSTGSFARMTVAALISSAIFFSISFYTLKQVTPLLDSLGHFQNFYQGYLKSAYYANRAFITLNAAYPLSKELYQSLGASASAEVVALSKNVKEELAKSAAILWNLHNDNAPLLESLPRDLNDVSNLFVFVGSGLLVPISLSWALISITHEVWIKTVTPADVKTAAQKAKKQLEAPKEQTPQKWMRTFKVLAISGAIAGGFAGLTYYYTQKK